jgi:hypothetical protein
VVHALTLNPEIQGMYCFPTFLPGMCSSTTFSRYWVSVLGGSTLSCTWLLNLHRRDVDGGRKSRVHKVEKVVGGEEEKLGGSALCCANLRDT